MMNCTLMTKTISLAILIAFILSATAMAHSPAEIEAAYSSGMSLMEEGDLAGALPLLEEVQKEKPGYKKVRQHLITLYRFVGIDHYSNHRFDEAVIFWQKILIIDPGNEEVERYIERTKNEQKMMAKLQGEPTPSPEISMVDPKAIPPGPAIPKPTEEPAAPQETVEPIDRTQIADPAPAANYSTDNSPKIAFSSGLAIGLAVPQGEKNIKQQANLVFSGNMSAYSAVNTLGGRLDITYSKLNQEATDVNSNVFDRYISILGASVSASGQVTPIPRQSFPVFAGIGLYEVSRFDDISTPDKHSLERETKPGYIFGAGWRHSLGDLAATVEIRYLIMSSSLAPNSLQLMIGLQLL
jgi:hypothetical protein